MRPDNSTPEQLRDTSRPSPTREESVATSLFNEVRETLRRILQHSVFVSLLTLRLYMLPLFYVAHKLARGTDPWFRATCDLLRPSHNLSRSARCHAEEPSSDIFTPLRTAQSAVFSVYQVVKNLYALGKILSQNPNILERRALVAGPSDADQSADRQSELGGDHKAENGESDPCDLEPPASASQIYHAALLNGSNLNDILTEFETHGVPTPTQRPDRRAAVDQTVSADADTVASPQRISDPPGQELQYQCSSIQTTPEPFRAPPERQRHSLGSSPRATNDLKAAQVQTPKRVMEVNQENQEPALPKLDSIDPLKIRPRFIRASGQIQDERVTQVEKRATSTQLKRCPTFVRRQTQSRLPKGPSSIDNRSPPVLQKRTTLSAPSLNAGSPKRARLQRRIRVHCDPIETP